MNKIGIFIFRKDLRLEDNLGLINLSKECKQIIPIFILDEYQIDINNTNKYYRSNNAIQFMCESLIDLNKQLNNKLNLYKGNPVEILNILLKVLKNYEEIIISYNCDYTKYALERDNKINNLINKFKNIKILNEENDITLVPFNQLIKSNNSAYMVFGAFYKNAIKTKVNNTIKNNFKNYIKLENISKLKVQVVILSSSSYTRVYLFGLSDWIGFIILRLPIGLNVRKIIDISKYLQQHKSLVHHLLLYL